MCVSRFFEVQRHHLDVALIGVVGDIEPELPAHPKHGGVIGEHLSVDTFETRCRAPIR